MKDKIIIVTKKHYNTVLFGILTVGFVIFNKIEFIEFIYIGSLIYFRKNKKK